MKPIIECVPNFSEGRNQDSIRQIAAEITSVEGIRLLGVDAGVDTHRTVVTFVGPPREVVEAAFRAIRKAAQLIDMAVHKGAHPRMGATDVCPLVPVSGITKEECVAHARALAKRVGTELGIPVYLYGYAASRPERTSLPDIREGEYEALPLKMKMPGFVPDEGPASFNPQAGATVIGVRDFMLAYNVNLNTTDATLAKEIAMNIRESGRAKRDAQGAIVKDAQGTTVKVPGRLVSCQADGWYIAQHGCAQITMNLHNYRAVGLHTAFDAVGEEAARLGLRATGSELIGLVPKQAILDAGAHYLRKQGKTAGVPEESLIHCAVRSLGLNEVTEFTPEEKIVEYAVADKRKRLVDMSVKGFVNELSSSSPAPGGGSVAALSGALSAGLASMVANLTYGRKGYEAHAEAMDALAVQSQSLKSSCLELIDRDTDAFTAYMEALRMPKKSDAEKQLREEALQRAARGAVEVPLLTLRVAKDLASGAHTAIEQGNQNALSDAAVCSLQAYAAAYGAWMNVMINLPTLTDTRFVETTRHEADAVLDSVADINARAMGLARQRMPR